MICLECGSDMHVSSDPITENFRGEELTIAGLTYHLCDHCGEIMFDAQEGEKYDALLVEQYAKRVGLLTPCEIKQIRKKYGINQQEFEKILGISTPSVSRWETGRVPQSKPVDILMRILDTHPDVMEERMRQTEIHHVRT